MGVPSSIALRCRTRSPESMAVPSAIWTQPTSPSARVASLFCGIWPISATAPAEYASSSRSEVVGPAIRNHILKPATAAAEAIARASAIRPAVAPISRRDASFFRKIAGIQVSLMRRP